MGPIKNDLLTVLNFTKDSWRATRPKGLIQKQIVKPFFPLIYLEVWGLKKKEKHITCIDDDLHMIYTSEN